MRLWLSGPRILNGLVRPGISLGRDHFRRAALRSGSQFIAMPARYEFADFAHIAFSLAGRSGAAAMALAGALR